MDISVEQTLAQTTPLEVASTNTRAARAALSADDIVGQNVDARRAATLAARGFANASPLLAEAARRLPSLDLALVRSIPELADALLYAQGAVDAHAREARVIATLAEEGTSLRDELYADLIAAGTRGYVEPRRLKEVTRNSGFRPVASDLLVLVRVARDAEDALEGRSHVTNGALERAGRVAAALWHAIGENDAARVTTSAPADERARALTLLVRAYDELQRAVGFLRWNEGDAHAFTPSLYGYRARRARKNGDDDEAVAPAASAQAKSEAD